MATSKLQRKLSKILFDRYEEFGVKENSRPEWLYSKTGERLELDFLLDLLDIAVEVQGAQHYQYTEHFHGSYDDFLSQVERDERKRYICSRRGIKLIEIDTQEEIQTVIDAIEEKLKELDMDEPAEHRFESKSQKMSRQVKAAKRVKLQKKMSKMYSLSISTKKYPVIKYKQEAEGGRNLIIEMGADSLAALRDGGKAYIDLIRKLIDRYENEQAKLTELRGGKPAKKKWGKLKRAQRLLQIEQIDKWNFIVWGGENKHNLMIIAGIPVCDCPPSQRGLECSHVVKYRITYGNEER